jgi:hypothetical protein
MILTILRQIDKRFLLIGKKAETLAVNERVSTLIIGHLNLISISHYLSLTRSITALVSAFVIRPPKTKKPSLKVRPDLSVFH